MRTSPRTERGRTSRDRIIQAAADLMGTRGVEGTSVEAVLAAAGAGKSQLYHYFRDKRGLVSAVIAYRYDTVILAHGARIDAIDSWEGLRDWFAELVEVQQERDFRLGCPVGSLASELSDHDDDARSDLAAAFERWEVGIRALLDRLRDRGLLAAGADTAALATATLASIQGAFLLSKTFQAPERMRATLDQTYRLLRSHSPGVPPARSAGRLA